jgi:hypothetical protein
MHIKLKDLEPLIKKVVNEDVHLIKIEPIHGGAQKVVYKLTSNNGRTYILYVWDLSKNYVLMHKKVKDSASEKVEHSYGAERFETNTVYLNKLGVRVPRIFYIDRTQLRYPFDFAIVEDVGTCDLTRYIEIYPEKKQAVLEKLNLMLRNMHEHHADYHGQLVQSVRFKMPSQTCEQLVLIQTLKDLEELSERQLSISQNKLELTNIINKLFHHIQPRRQYGLIHHELGPDHIRVDQTGEPILIDIEGAKFFDIEYEHAFLEFRFGENYSYLKNDQLDPKRLRFYKLHLHISCSIGPLKIIENGFPQADFMRKIADYNIKATLDFLNTDC